MQTVRFPSPDSRLHKDDVIAEKIAVIIKTAVPGSCTITSGIHGDHISNAQINACFPMSEELGYKILDWLEKIDFHMKEAVYFKDGEKRL
ncbi:amino acid decarboxylase, partial [Enterococcus faecium]